MQERNSKLAKTLGEIFKKLRNERTELSVNKLADAYEIGRGSLSKIENGKVESKFSTIWKLSESVNIRPSVLVKMIEDELGEDFKLIDE